MAIFNSYVSLPEGNESYGFIWNMVPPIPIDQRHEVKICQNNQTSQ